MTQLHSDLFSRPKEDQDNKILQTDRLLNKFVPEKRLWSNDWVMLNFCLTVYVKERRSNSLVHRAYSNHIARKITMKDSTDLINDPGVKSSIHTLVGIDHGYFLR